MTMPNFLIVGAQKAGTTSLHYYLKQHPQIYMSPRKEPHFFEGMHWEAAELSLVRSDLPVDGVVGEQPRYEVVQAWPLGR